MLVGDDQKGSGLFSKCEADLKKYGSTVVCFQYTQKVPSTKMHEKLQSPPIPLWPKLRKLKTKAKKSIR